MVIDDKGIQEEITFLQKAKEKLGSYMMECLAEFLIWSGELNQGKSVFSI
jgi:hypothetical protein